MQHGKVKEMGFVGRGCWRVDVGIRRSQVVLLLALAIAVPAEQTSFPSKYRHLSVVQSAVKQWLLASCVEV